MTSVGVNAPNRIAVAHFDDFGAEGRGDDELRTSENASASGFAVEHGAETEGEIGHFRGGFFEHADRARRGHGELDAGEPAGGEGLGAVEKPVRTVGADQSDDLFGLNLGEYGVFFHGEEGRAKRFHRGLKTHFVGLGV
jgi:hypothetical protein